MKKRKPGKVKQVRRAIGRLSTPAPKIIPDKRAKLIEESKKREIEEGS